MRHRPPLVMIALLQSLLMQSEKNSGLVFTRDLDKLPFGISFAYLYLLTLLAVLYSIFWAWIDLDARRLEPYYQLSKPGGSLGEDSILLHYPFDFIASVPIAAVKNR